MGKGSVPRPIPDRKGFESNWELTFGKKKNDEAADLEKQVLAHRYLYYVLAEPILPDLDYDVLERKARAVCSADSPVQGVGSSLPSSYSAEVVEYAKQISGN
jgi:NAD-dependent DNA ligase